MPNIYDVAKKAGVGIGTVSRVINNSPHISPETKKRVKVAIKELNYRPQTAAQSLARRKTNTIGCIIPFFTGHFFMQLLRGLQRKVTEFEYDLILYSVDMANSKEKFLQRVLNESRVDGLLLVSLEISDHYVERFHNVNMPLVLVDGFHKDLDYVRVDNIGGAYKATRHLIDLGYRRIGMIDGKLESSPAKLRFEGFKKALSEAGQTFEQQHFISCDFTDEADGFNRESGYAAMLRLLDLGSERPEVVFVSSDIQAIGAIEAAKSRGVRVPDDIGVVGFDDIELSEFIELTTVRQPTMTMGRLAVEQLVNRMNKKDAKGLQQSLDTDLVVRESCGAELRKQPVLAEAAA